MTENTANNTIQINENDFKELIYNALMEALEEKIIDSNENDVVSIDPDMNLGIESIY